MQHDNMYNSSEMRLDEIYTEVLIFKFGRFVKVGTSLSINYKY